MKKIFPLFSLYFLTITSWACSCAGKPDLKKSIEGSAIVVSAVVLSETIEADLQQFSVIEGDTNDIDYKFNNYPSKVVRLKVTKVFKGQVSSDTITVITAPDGAACGVHFQTGKQYIIYGQAEVNASANAKRKAINNNVYWTHLCTRTGQWKKEEESEIKKLIRK